MMLFGSKTKEEINSRISMGANINAQESLFGQSYLHILVQSESPLLDHFLTKLPNTNLQNKEGKTPIFYAKNIQTVQKLILHGASFSIKDLNGKSVSTKVSVDYTKDLTKNINNKLYGFS